MTVPSTETVLNNLRGTSANDKIAACYAIDCDPRELQRALDDMTDEEYDSITI